MSECQGEGCTHPECTHGQPKPTVEELRARIGEQIGYSSEKWAAMNRAERRAARRGTATGDSREVTG